nr:MAG TPA: hypothetical protein [Caudoviricetes sp.]
MFVIQLNPSFLAFIYIDDIIIKIFVSNLYFNIIISKY